MADRKKLPESENPFHFAAKRFEEMSQLLNVLKTPKQTKLAFQTLPKHMRRRAATQNPKRLPRRVRSTHISQFKKSGTPLKGKRPTRKYRRKPSNLRLEYAKRDSHTKWLETHIWHAKRFHMISRWGYKLPWSPCDKGYRACYRATSKYCLMQDLTYYNTIEVSGPVDLLKEGFKKITSSKCGLTLNAACYRNGQREGETYLFKRDQYPLGCLTKVTFFWHPQPADSPVSTIWISIHPSAVTIVKQELIDLFQLLNTDQGSIYEKDNVRLRHFERSLNRFRLSGPLAHSVVTRALKGVTIQNRNDNPLHEYLSNQSPEIQAAQQGIWSLLQNCQSAAQLPSSTILSLVVEDPRLNRPGKRSKELARENTSYIAELPDHLTKSALFSADVLSSLEANIMCQKTYSKSRNNSCIVPGQTCKFEESLQAVPIILIQRPGDDNDHGRLGFSGGWDVLIPRGYGSIFWLSFIMWGARAGGLREHFSNDRESKRQCMVPDTLEGNAESALARKVSWDSYFRKPCNKRPNYLKLAIASPFNSPWKQLIGEWGGEPGTHFVIRDKSILAALLDYLKGVELNLSIITPELTSSLVPITYRMIGRGNPGPNSIICLPTTADFKSTINQSPKQNSNHPIYTEPLKTDPFEETRKSCRKAHLRLLAKMRRGRVKAKRLKQLTSGTKVVISKPLTEKLIMDQHRKMCELWVPSKSETIRQQCSRETIGYSTSADYSLIEGTCCGIGYVTFPGLVQLIKSHLSKHHRGNVLIRNSNSRNYRLAKITINWN